MTPTRTGPSGLITGVVTDEQGRPLAEATVALGDAPVPVPDIAALTGPDGAFALAAPVPGSYTVVAAAPGHGAGRVGVQVQAGRALAPVRVMLTTTPPT
jgi:hypothetical protein